VDQRLVQVHDQALFVGIGRHQHAGQEEAMVLGLLVFGELKL
jgi:hypothetical protein